LPTFKSNHRRRADHFQATDAARFVRAGRADAANAVRVNVNRKGKAVTGIKIRKVEDENVITASAFAGITVAGECHPGRTVNNQVFGNRVATCSVGVENHVGENGRAQVNRYLANALIVERLVLQHK
jgi:hypothetical protein